MLIISAANHYIRGSTIVQRESIVAIVISKTSLFFLLSFPPMKGMS